MSNCLHAKESDCMKRCETSNKISNQEERQTAHIEYHQKKAKKIKKIKNRLTFHRNTASIHNPEHEMIIFPTFCTKVKKLAYWEMHTYERLSKGGTFRSHSNEYNIWTSTILFVESKKIEWMSHHFPANSHIHSVQMAYILNSNYFPLTSEWESYLCENIVFDGKTSAWFSGAQWLFEMQCDSCLLVIC